MSRRTNTGTDSSESKTESAKNNTLLSHNDFDSWSRFESNTSVMEFCDEPTIFVGIDLGTTNSCISVWNQDKHRVKVVRNRKGFGLLQNTKLLPSVLMRQGLGSTAPSSLVGQLALDKSAQSSNTIITCSKRIIGLHWDDCALQAVLPDLPITVVRGRTPDEDALIQISEGSQDALISPVEVASLILKELKECMEAFLSSGKIKSVTFNTSTRLNAVVTVPVHFTEIQRQATKEAAHQAGFKHVVTMAESTAAAMAYGLFVTGEKTVCVFDIGGGTTDCSLLKLNEGVFQILATNGDTHLGGEEMDQRLLDWALNKSGSGKLSPNDLYKLRQACCQAKVELSEKMESRILLRPTPHAHKQTHLIDLLISRPQFEELIYDLVERTRVIVQQVLEAGKMKGSDVQEVVLVGGCSRVPALRKMLTEIFGEKEFCSSVSPDLAIAEGAAIRAAILAGVDKSYLQDVMMLDALPLSIGVETADGKFDPILLKNSPIPAEAFREYQLEFPDQKGVTLEVYEGDKEFARDNQWVAHFNIPLLRLSKEKLANYCETNPRRVKVFLKMTNEGCLCAHIKEIDVDEVGDQKAVMIVWFYIVLMSFCYIWCRIYFGPTLAELQAN